ncbi:MAG TPA: lipopolysaccharide transport periplasmic protein LptA [Gallionella sp.]
MAVCAVAASLLLGAPASFAELSDREQPINLEANQVTVDDARQISTFTGNVRLSQGTLLILGDMVVVTQDKGGFLRVVSHGKPASFRQKREAAEGYVEGYGERIEYGENSEILFLDGQAHLKRDRDEVTGEHITYNCKTEVFQVNAIETQTGVVPKTRVRVVLQPKPKPDANTPPAPNKQPVGAGVNIKPVEPK